MFSARTKIVYVADGTNDSPTSPSRRARATEAGKDVLRRPFLAVYMLLLIAGCSEGPQMAPVEASPEDTPYLRGEDAGGKPAGPARDSTSGVPEGPSTATPTGWRPATGSSEARDGYPKPSRWTSPAAPRSGSHGCRWRDLLPGSSPKRRRD
jgi:hypothetical protein